MALPLLRPADGYLRLSYTGPAGVVGVATQSWDLSEIPAAVRASEGFKRSFLVFARPISPGLSFVDPVVSFLPAVGVPNEIVLTVTAAGAADELALDVWCLHSIIGAVADESKAYFLSPPGGPGAVTSVFTRVGAVVAAIGDYVASQIGNDSVVPGAFVSDALNTLAAAIPPPAPVSSVFARVGAVVATVGDYTFGQIAGTISDVQHANRGGGTLHAVATTVLAGFMSGADKTKLDALSTTKYKFFEAETNAANTGHRVRNIGAAGNFDFNFEVPADFNTLVAVQMWGASRTATNAAANNVTATSSYGVPPAAPNALSTAANLTVAFTAGQLLTYSIASVFGALAAGAQCAVNISHNGIGGSVDYYGIMLVYT